MPNDSPDAAPLDADSPELYEPDVDSPDLDSPDRHPPLAGAAAGALPVDLPRRTRVVIIGAGQAGLSVAYHLRRRGLEPGVDFVVVDRGPGTGGAWQFRWESLRLGTAHRVNDLPGMEELGLSFDTADRTRAARDVVAEYYRLYEAHFALRIVRPATVIRVDDASRAAGSDSGSDSRSGSGFSVTTSVGTIVCEVLVNASGTWAAPVRPWYAGIDEFAGRQLTTPQYRCAAEFAGQRVIVVGGGTSAVGFLLELESVAATTTWVTRRPVEFVGDGGLDVESLVSAVAMQDATAQAGGVLSSIVGGTGLPATARNVRGVERGVLVAHPLFDHLEETGARWADGTLVEADAIIWATGFRSELGHLDPLRLREPGGGVRVERGRVALDPRVFLAGYGPQASTIGANRAGRVVASQVLDALQHPGHPEPSAHNQPEPGAAAVGT